MGNDLSYEEFIEQIVRNIKDYLPNDWSEAEVQITPVQKMNGIILDGLTVHRTEDVLNANIYLEGFYDKYQGGVELTTIMNEIANGVLSIKKIDGRAILKSLNQEDLRKNINPRVIGYKDNEKFLETTPCIKKEDMAIVFYMNLGQLDPTEENMSSSIRLNEDIRETYFADMSIEEIFQLAEKNYCRDNPPKLESMENVIQKIIETEDYPEDVREEYEQEVKKPTGMYVASNDNRAYGAVVIFNKEFMHEVAKQIGSDINIIPSSVHEVLLVPVEADRDREADALLDMVKEVNENVLNPEEKLTDTIYCYHDDERTIEIVANDEILQLCEDLENYGTKAVEWSNPEYMNNRTVVERLMNINPDTYKYASEKVRANEEVIKKAITLNMDLLRYVPEEKKNMIPPVPEKETSVQVEPKNEKKRAQQEFER